MSLHGAHPDDLALPGAGVHAVIAHLRLVPELSTYWPNSTALALFLRGHGRGRNEQGKRWSSVEDIQWKGSMKKIFNSIT
jgi:hypothetical protein